MCVSGVCVVCLNVPCKLEQKSITEEVRKKFSILLCHLLILYMHACVLKMVQCRDIFTTIVIF